MNDPRHWTEEQQDRFIQYVFDQRTLLDKIEIIPLDPYRKRCLFWEYQQDRDD